jgi:hypothetical protein
VAAAPSSGNLVTNATWEHFWLNEGFTVYLERKILGRLYGEQVRCGGVACRACRLHISHLPTYAQQQCQSYSQGQCVGDVCVDVSVVSAAVWRGLVHPGLARPGLAPQMYQLQASMGWLELQDAVKKEFGEGHKYTALVPDLSGARACPPALLPCIAALPLAPAGAEVPIPSGGRLAEAADHRVQAVWQHRAPFHPPGARPFRFCLLINKLRQAPGELATPAPPCIISLCCVSASSHGPFPCLPACAASLPALPASALVPASGGVDPDDAFSSVPYEKGFAFIHYLQASDVWFGRQAADGLHVAA